MSQDIKMKPVRKPSKKVELTWIQSRMYHISVLFLVITVILTLVGATAIHYRVFEKNTIIISSVSAAEKPKEEIFEEGVVEPIDCETAVKKYSNEYQAPEDLMQRIMRSESGNVHTAENKSSTATGCFQWIIGSWRLYGKELWKEEFYGKNVYNPSDNVELAAYVISKYGTDDWNASRHSWGR